MPIPQLTQKIQEKSPWRKQTNKKFLGVFKKKGNKSFLSYIISILIICFVLMVIGAVAVFAWFSRDLPTPDGLLSRNLAQSTKIFDRSGENLLYDIHGEEKRTVINLEDIPDNMKWATVAVEDKNFYTHKGFDLLRIIKAAFIDFTSGGKAVQGASTITQQFVKNAILTPEKTISRKIREVVLSYELERRFSKDQILRLYLNEIPYGSNAYGVQSAAQTFFGKNAKDLTLSESALLAALPQAPTYYSPYGNHKEDLINRQHLILRLMAEQGYITQEEADKASQEELVFQAKRENISAPHFVFYVKEQLVAKYGEKMVEQGGLKVTTTLDYNKQKVAEEVITEKAPQNESRYGATNAALVSLDTKTGEILAMVGSRDYFDIENDGNVNVTIRDRQPGSSFKPVVYATAFKNGYTPETMLFDLKTDFGNYSPSNYTLRENGPLSMRKALAGSLNIPAVKTLYLAGLDNVLETAHEMGYTTLNDRERYGLSLVLGGGEVKLLEHTSAFATFAREGIRHPTLSILKVEDANGRVLEEAERKEFQVVPQTVAQQINSILSDNEARSFIFGASNYLTLSDRPVAAKTGTTNDFRDAWTLGYTPSIATGVWVGKNDNTEMWRGADGSVVAAPIWQEFMKRALAGTPVEYFHVPPTTNVEKPILRGEFVSTTNLKVDSLTGRAIPEDCQGTYPQKYIAEKEIKEVHDILHYIDKYNPQGPIPEHPENDSQYANWEAPVKAWAQGNGYVTETVKIEEEDCHLRDNQPTLEIISPTNEEILTSGNIEIKIEYQSNEEISEIKYYINNELIRNRKNEPFDFVYQSALDNGFYTLKVVLTDIIGNTTEKEINFNLQIPRSAASIYFINPNQNTNLNSSQFPFDIEVSAYDPQGTASVTLYYFDANLDDPDYNQIDKAVNPKDSNINFTWENPPATGSYKIYAELISKKDRVTQTDNLTIAIGE